MDYNDPYIPSLSKTRHYNFNLSSVNLDESALKGYDCLLIITDHSCYDYEFLLEHAPLIVDTRGVIKKNHQRVIRA